MTVETAQPGDAGVWQTLSYMRGLALQQALTPVVRTAAESILRGAGSRTRPEHAHAIRQWLSERVQFVHDPVHAELVKDPVAMLHDCRTRYYTMGDCDDVATLGASLGASIGLLPRFVVLAFGPDGPFTHVYTELFDESRGWVVDLDITRPMQDISVESSRAAVMEF